MPAFDCNYSPILGSLFTTTTTVLFQAACFTITVLIKALLLLSFCPVDWGCVEYTDCTSAEGVPLSLNECPDMTLNYLMVRFQ